MWLKEKNEEIINSKIFVPEPTASPQGVRFKESYDEPFRKHFIQKRNKIV
jgi:hypothetical protein